MMIAYFILGLAIGGGLIFIVLKNNAKSQISIFEDKINYLTTQKDEIQQQLNFKDEKLSELSIKHARNEEINKNLEQKLTEQKDELNKIQDKFRDEFKNLANEILDDKSKKFTEQNKINIDQILKPLNERIIEFKSKVEEVYVNENKERFSLKEEVKRLAELNIQMSKEAHSLTNALKGESKTQGNWGEMILESILEKSGLTKDREYFVQNSYTTEDGQRFQPDVVIKYPDNRSIVVDSKVSLVDYERYCSADNDDDKQRYLKAHIQSIKNHISGLSQKKYQDIYEINTLDFVMMFLPIEPAYLLAIQVDTQLWSYAYDKRILLISPTNLIASLKMLESMWRQEYQNRNAQDIARKSGEMYDKFVSFTEDLLKLGNQLNTTKNTYDESMKKLSTGNGNLVRKSQEILDLGISSKKSKNINPNLLDRALE